MIETPISLLETVSTQSTVLLTATDFLTSTIINQIDRKFILIKIPTSTASIIALIDQHAADERYRLETIIKFLPTSIHQTNINIPFPQKYLPTLSKRKYNLRQWGIDIELTNEGVRLVGIPGVIKDIDEGRWKGILSSYVLTHAADDCPSGLMDMFCSKACRSVLPPFQEMIQAIMFNDILTKDECEGIIRRLSSCMRPFICAHGRPCIATITRIPS